jgi:hypothetical protein
MVLPKRRRSQMLARTAFVDPIERRRTARGGSTSNSPSEKAG